MGYKRIEDQYKIGRAREMIEELNYKPKCTFSIVLPYNKIIYNEVEHAGVLTHICSLDKGHIGPCECAKPCSVKFQGWR